MIGDKTIPCIVRDMSDSGLLIISAEGLEVGQRLKFVCELFPQKTLECKIEVVHISNVGAGARFVELDARRENMVRVYLQEVFALGGKLRR